MPPALLRGSAVLWELCRVGWVQHGAAPASPHRAPLQHPSNTWAQAPSSLMDILVSFFGQKGFLLYVLRGIRAFGGWNGKRGRGKPNSSDQGAATSWPRGKTGQRGPGKQDVPPGKSLWKYSEGKLWPRIETLEEGVLKRLFLVSNAFPYFKDYIKTYGYQCSS